MSNTDISRPSAVSVVRQPSRSISHAVSGAIVSPPVDVPIMASVIARPRWTANQRAISTDMVSEPEPITPIASGTTRIRALSDSDRDWPSATRLLPNRSEQTSMTRRAGT